MLLCGGGVCVCKCTASLFLHSSSQADAGETNLYYAVMEKRKVHINSCGDD